MSQEDEEAEDNNDTQNADQYYVSFTMPPGMDEESLNQTLNNVLEHDFFLYLFEGTPSTWRSGYVAVSSVEALEQVKNVLPRLANSHGRIDVDFLEHYREPVIPSRYVGGILLQSRQVARTEPRRSPERPILQQPETQYNQEQRTIHVGRGRGFSEEAEIKKKIEKWVSCGCNSLIDDINLRKSSSGGKEYALIRACSAEKANKIVEKLKQKYPEKHPRIATKEWSPAGHQSERDQGGESSQSQTTTAPTHAEPSQTTQAYRDRAPVIVSSTEEEGAVQPYRRRYQAQSSGEESDGSPRSQPQNENDDPEVEEVKRAMEESRLAAERAKTGGEPSSEPGGSSSRKPDRSPSRKDGKGKGKGKEKKRR